MNIPYGMANFADLRREGYFYADKTPFISVLEHANTARYLLLLRPRRAGKSLLLNMLADYYDRARAGSFDELFAGLSVHQHPTPLRGRYLVLQMDFSTVDTGSGPELLEASFVDSVRAQVRDFLRRYQDVFPAYRALLDRLEGYKSATSLMLDLFSADIPPDQKFYVLIDEYDSFATELLARRRADLYHDVIGGAGFVRTFYKALKLAAGKGTVARLLATGVSPVMLDDLSSGFNILTQITLSHRYNAICGFTRAEVEQAVDELLEETPGLAQRDRLVADLIGAYNGYLFSERARERLCNPDMVLYFLQQLRDTGAYPQDLLDKNVRTDYGKLRQVASPPGGAEAWHQRLIETILTEGGLASPIVDRFGARHLYEPAHLTSLLYYMGLLTIGGARDGQLWLEVPNLVMRRMHWEEVTVVLREQTGIVVDTGDLAAAVSRMAYHGELQPFLDLIQQRVLQVLSNRDLMKFDEKHLKMILLSYLSLSPIYRPLSEKEMAQGYSDLLLALDRRFPDARFAYLLELKHVRSGASEEEIAAASAEGAEQINRYLGDSGLLPALMGERGIHAAVVVFIGARGHRLHPVRTLPPP